MSSNEPVKNGCEVNVNGCEVHFTNRFLIVDAYKNRIESTIRLFSLLNSSYACKNVMTRAVFPSF